MKIQWSLALACFSSSLPDVASGNDGAEERPNIVVIMSDDMGWSDVAPFGGEIETPTLTRLADGGLRFTQFYNTSRCCPTRASLLTGLYPHQAGMGWMRADRQLPGYQGEIRRDTPTMAEVLGGAGYATYMSGKWHVCRNLNPDGDRSNWPLQRGFDRFFGTIIGAGSLWDPATLCRGNTFVTPENDPDYEPETWFYTDAISDEAARYIHEHEGDEPFFLYVSYTAAHWPMHAHEEDIAKYRGRYDAGYAEVSAARVKRLKAMGLVDPEWTPHPLVGDWDAVEHREWEIACMEVYAAMVDCMDQGISDIVKALEEEGELDNTLLVYLQDNGGCAEPFGRGSNAKDIEGKTFEPLGRDGLQTKIWPPMQTRDGRPVRTGPGVIPGPADTFIAYGENWANVSNTPFTGYKHHSHEGGVSSPLIVHWPAGIESGREGALIRDPAHLIDLMATAVDLAGAEPQLVVPHQGVSLLPALRGKGERLDRARPIFFEHEGGRAMRDGDWKIVATPPPGKWELYNMAEDRTETNNLAEQQPKRLAKMAAAWEAWAVEAKVKPWPHDPKPRK